MTYDEGLKSVWLRVFDSEPSAVFRRDVRRVRNKLLPSLKLAFVKCVYQERSSNGCGLFMLAHIFADTRRTKVKD
jgi:hypothetical protein